MVYIVPVDVPKEWLVHDFLRIRRSASQSLIGLPSKELLEYGHRVSGHVDRVKGLVAENGIINFILVFAPEWRLLQEHLINQDAESPPIHGSPIFLVE